MRKDVSDIVDYFCGKNIFPVAINLLILEISGAVRVGRRSLSYVTNYLPCFRGKIWSNDIPFNNQLYFLRKNRRPFIIYHHRLE